MRPGLEKFIYSSGSLRPMDNFRPTSLWRAEYISLLSGRAIKLYAGWSPSRAVSPVRWAALGEDVMKQAPPTALMQCFRSFHTAALTTEGIEAMHMRRKGQVKKSVGRDAAARAKFVESPIWRNETSETVAAVRMG